MLMYAKLRRLLQDLRTRFEETARNMNTPLTQKLKQIILASKPEEWAKKKWFDDNIWIYEKDNLKIVFEKWDEGGNFRVYLKGYDHKLYLRESRKQELMDFCDELFSGQEDYPEGSEQGDMALEIYNFRATS